MPVIVKPISANLTKDADGLGKAVFIIIYLRIPTVSFGSVKKNNKHKHIKVQANNHNGLIPFNSNLPIAFYESKSGMMIPSAMTLLEKELLTSINYMAIQIELKIVNPTLIHRIH